MKLLYKIKIRRLVRVIFLKINFSFLVLAGIMIFEINSAIGFEEFNQIRKEPLLQGNMQEPRVVAPGWALETIVAPAKTVGAPFDVAVLPDGRIITAGSSGRMVSIGPDGQIEPTNYSCPGTYFEASKNGKLWSYNLFSGELFVQDASENSLRKVAQIPVSVGGHGSLAVSPQGDDVYFNFWGDAEGKESPIYKYDGQRLTEIRVGEEKGELLSIEVASDGKIYIATTKGIYLLNSENNFEKVFDLMVHIVPDSLTSDNSGNLYLAAQGGGDWKGIYKISLDGSVKKILDISPEEPITLGMAWDEKRQVLLAAGKEEQEIFQIDAGKKKGLLKSSGLTAPIALAIHPNGDIYVNGDEVGVLKVDSSGKVSIFRMNICCYQPPPADMVFDRNGLLYYTEAAPGFKSRIISIDSQGSIEEITDDVGCPSGITMDTQGQIFYADYENGAIYRLDENGFSIPVVVDLAFPAGLTIGKDNSIYVSAAMPGTKGNPHNLNEPCRQRIVKFNRNSKPEEVYRTQSNLSFFDVDANNNLYIPDQNRLVIRYKDGRVETIADGFKWARDAKIAKDGSIYLTDYAASALYRIKRRDNQ